MEEYIGVDGCKAGWFAISLTGSKSWNCGVYADIESIWRSHSGAKLILIDIPIGLLDSGRNGRECDSIARRYLGSIRASSVFTPPTRPALDKGDRLAASELNKSLTGRKITIQSWVLAPKIREVDQFLRRHKEVRGKIREAHPELLFWAFNNQKAMSNRKKTLIGYEERLAILQQVFVTADMIAEEALSRYRRSVVARDDILDALAAAITGYLSKGDLTSIPEPVPLDQYGLPMEMVYYPRH